MNGLVESTSDGFLLLLDGPHVARVWWDEVREIVTFKRDLFSFDMICLAFRLSNDEWVEVWEDDPGFPAMTAHLPARFPTIPADWYQQVMFPPFETCERVLWRCPAEP